MFDRLTAAIGSVVTAVTTVQHYIYGEADGQLTNHELVFVNICKKLCTQNKDMLPSGAVVLRKFMRHYFKRSTWLKNMHHDQCADECVKLLTNRGDEYLPHAMNIIRIDSGINESGINDSGHYSALLTVFFHYFPEHYPAQLINVPQKAISPAKHHLKTWFAELCPSSYITLTGNCLEALASAIYPEQADAYATELLNRLTMLSERNSEYDIPRGFIYASLGKLHHKLSSYNKLKIEKRLVEAIRQPITEMDLSIVGVAEALLIITIQPTNEGAAALIGLVSRCISAILLLQARTDLQKTREMHEKQLYFHKIFTTLAKYSNQILDDQKESFMVHLLKADRLDPLREEINMLRYWMSAEQLAQLRQMMANRNNDNNETWFLFRPWLNDRSFPKGRLPSKAEKKPYHDASLMRMLTPGDAGLFTYVMPVTARLTMLIRDLADEESSEYGGNAKIIPLAVIEYLYASLVKLREQQERIRESLNDNYMGNEQLRAINLSCIKLFKAIPLLKSADQFTNELRMNFATGILQIVDCPYAEMAFAEMAFIDKIEAVHAALSICPKLLENRQHTLTCQNILLMATKHRQYPHDVDDNQTVIDVSIIFANQLPLHELPRLMLALASNKCYLGNMAVSHMNQLYENRLAMATELRAKTVSTHSNAY